MAVRRQLQWCLLILLAASFPQALARNFFELGSKPSGYGYWQLDLGGDRTAPGACRAWHIHGSGVNMGDGAWTISTAFWSPSTGEVRRQSKREGGSANTAFDFLPGENEPVRLEMVWHTEFGDRKTVSELARLPLPMEFRARAGSDSVALSWDGIAECPERWLRGPEFVVLRLESGQLRFGYVSTGRDKRRCLLPTADPKEVFHSQTATVTNWTDRDVEVGKTYVYGLLVRGTMRVTTTYDDAKSVVTPVPVEIAALPHRWDQDDLFVTDWRCTRVATPGPPRPARLAVFHSEEYAPVLETRVSSLRKALAAEADMEIVERGIASTLLQEQDVQAMGGEGVKPVAAADLLVEYRLRTTYDQVFRDTWFHDFLNADSRRVASFPAKSKVGREEVEQIAAAVRAACPNAAARAPAEPTEKGKPKASLAVVPSEPLGGASGTDAALLTDLLVAEFDGAGARVVDRERVGEVFRELETDALASRAAELGRTVGADFFVAGSWGTVGATEARGSFRLVRARDGLCVSESDFSAADAADLAAAVAARFAPLVAGTVTAQPVGVVHRLLEARALYRARDERRLRERAGYMWQWEKLKDGQTAALTAPEDAGALAETARHYLRQGQTDRALDFLRNRLAKAGKTGSFWEAAEPLAGILRERGETTSEMLLWQGLLDKSEPTDMNYGCMAVLLAELLAEQGQTEEALACLQKVEAPPHGFGGNDFRMYRKGRLLERLRHHAEAAEAYAEDWRNHVGRLMPRDNFNRLWRPSLSAMVRLFQDREHPAAREIVLREMVAWHYFPHQATKAAQKLLQTDCTDRGVLWQALHPLLASGDEDAARETMLRLLTRGTGENPAPRYGSRFMSQRHSGKRVRAIGEALFPLTKLQATLPEEKAKARIAEIFANAPEVQPGKPRTDVRPTDFVMPDITMQALRQLKPSDTLLCIGRERVWALARGGSPFGRAVWSDEWPQGFGPAMGFGESIGAILPASKSEDGVAVLTTGTTGEIRAYDVAKGTRIWQHTCWMPVCRPVIRSGRVYVLNAIGDLHVLDLADGKPLAHLPHPLEAEVFRPSQSGIRPSPDGRALVSRGGLNIRYTLEPRLALAIPSPLPNRAAQKPSLLDVFCSPRKAPVPGADVPAPVAKTPPSKLDGLMTTLLDANKSVRERTRTSSDIIKELKRVPSAACERQLCRLVADKREDFAIRRATLAILSNLPGNPGAFLALPLMRENEGFVGQCLTIMGRESDVAWCEAVKAARAHPNANWSIWQQTEEAITNVNIERTARDGFLAPEIGWDHAAVDRAIGEHLASQKGVAPSFLYQWYEAAVRSGSSHLPRLEDILIGQVGGKRTTPVEVREDQPWLGTPEEAVAMVRAMDKVHPAARHLPLLRSVLRPTKDMRDWTLSTTQTLGVQQLLRIATPVAMDLAFASEHPLGRTRDDIRHSMDLLERASGRSLATLEEWRVWHRRAHTPD